MITMMKFSLIPTPPSTLTAQIVPSRPTLPFFDPNLHLNLLLIRLGCPPKSGLALIPPAKPYGIALMIKQSLSFWGTPSQSRNRITQQVTLLLSDVRLSINLVTLFKAQVNLHEMSAYDFLLANIHDAAPSGDDIDPHVTTQEDNEPPSSENINDMWLNNDAKSSRTDHLPSSTHIEYFVSNHEAILAHSMSLIDCGANGGVAGGAVCGIFRTNWTVDIKGIDNHHVINIGIGTVEGVVQTQHGAVIAVMHQYALLGKGASIYSHSQLEWYKSDVNDKSLHVTGGLQRIITLEGYIIPLAIKDGLACLDICPHTNHEFNTLPHVFSPRSWSVILPSFTISIIIPRNGEMKLLLLTAPCITCATMSLDNITNRFLSTICRTSHAKMVRLWMTILISAFSLHINRHLILLVNVMLIF
jgi:hypothetical protein